MTAKSPTLAPPALTPPAVSLAALQLQIEELQNRVRTLEERAAAVPAAPRAATAGAPSRPEIPWLVIAAAVAAVVKEPHWIVALELPGMPPFNIWAFEGRRAVFYSHQLRSN